MRLPAGRTSSSMPGSGRAAGSGASSESSAATTGAADTTSSSVSRSRPDPPGKSVEMTSPKFLATAPNVSAKRLSIVCVRSRIRPRSSLSDRSRSAHWSVSSSARPFASSYSSAASGLTAPRLSRRRSSRSRRAAATVASSGSSGADISGGSIEYSAASAARRRSISSIRSPLRASDTSISVRAVDTSRACTWPAASSAAQD